MALFTEIVFNERTGRHELCFVNQQHDDLMCISYRDELKEYAWGMPIEEVLKIARCWGREDFDARAYLERARVDLPVRDDERLRRS